MAAEPEKTGAEEGASPKMSGDELAVAEAFMQSAAASALAGVRIGHGGPFGASIVRDGVVVACAHNMVLHKSDPTKHAEMNAIQQACEALRTHDLSDCDLYTTCEPCPMCWGAVQWSRLGKVHIGVDRHTAAKYGFDDKVFYDEIDGKAGCYGLTRCGFIQDTSADGELKRAAERKEKNMVEVYDGVCHSEVAKLFSDPSQNRTLRRRFTSRELQKEKSHPELESSFQPVRQVSPGEHADQEEGAELDPERLKRHEKYMQLAIAAAQAGVKAGSSKEREPFGAVVVRGDEVVAEAHNSVLQSRDATATAEINAIRAAAAKLSTHNLEGCELYSTAHPDLMSLGAVLWARIARVYCGVTQQMAAEVGFEEGLLHLKDLVEEGGGERAAGVVRGVAMSECEAVFREWSDRNGVIY